MGASNTRMSRMAANGSVLKNDSSATTRVIGQSSVCLLFTTGGTQPYAYQWQVYNPKTKQWVDLKGFTDSAMSRKDIEKQWDGARFRCVVTDATGAQIVSREFTLTVRDKVPTGDNTHLPLYLAVALAALALMGWLRRRERKKSGEA